MAARMVLAETIANATRRMINDQLPLTVADLATLRPHAVARACTSGGAVLGAEGEAELPTDNVREMGAPAISSNDAVGAAIERQGRQRGAVLTPNIDELNETIRIGFERRDLKVVHIAGLGITDNFGICSVAPADVAAVAEREPNGRDFDPPFVFCPS